MNGSNIRDLRISGDIKGPPMWPYVNPPTFESYWFEKWDAPKQMGWIERNKHNSFYICAAYFALIFIGRRFMLKRKAFDLRKSFALWNFGFMVFSVVGFVRSVPELVYVIFGDNGFHRSVCIRDGHNETAAFWAWLMALSKVVELGDTAFVVVRKKPLNPVQYVHHGLALVLTWFIYPIYEPVLRYIGMYNYFLHSVLYAYLFLKSVGVKLPKHSSKIVLSLEMLQLVMGFTLNMYAGWVKVKGEQCERRMDVAIAETLFYVIYGGVLVNYFRKSFIRSRAKSKKDI